MTYTVETFDIHGRRTGTLGPFSNVASARQAMLDASGTTELSPLGPEYHIPGLRIIEGGSSAATNTQSLKFKQLGNEEGGSNMETENGMDWPWIATWFGITLALIWFWVTAAKWFLYLVAS